MLLLTNFNRYVFIRQLFGFRTVLCQPAILLFILYSVTLVIVVKQLVSSTIPLATLPIVVRRLK
jgi:hypothetical protein